MNVTICDFFKTYFNLFKIFHVEAHFSMSLFYEAEWTYHTLALYSLVGGHLDYFYYLAPSLTSVNISCVFVDQG